jgi:alkylated DNA repair dioxygenase AlkB
MTSIIPEGLSLELDVITPEKEKEIITWLDNREWSTELSRRTQHYGYSYNYRSGDLKPINPIEGPLLDIANMIEKAGLMKPVQCIANEYYREQGISPHIDHLSFGPTVIGLSIGGDTVMTFNHIKSNEIFNCFLPQRSIMMMTGPARYEWKHSIGKTVSYINSSGMKITKPQNYRRISLTYRTIS